MNNRGLKFRAWDGRKMRYWGFLEAGIFQGIPTESGGLDYPQMQYTDQHSIDNQEVYAEDLLRFPCDNDSLYKMAWNREESAFEVYYYSPIRQSWVAFGRAGIVRFMRVAGNTFEGVNIEREAA